MLSDTHTNSLIRGKKRALLVHFHLQRAVAPSDDIPACLAAAGSISNSLSISPLNIGKCNPGHPLVPEEVTHGKDFI